MKTIKRKVILSIFILVALFSFSYSQVLADEVENKLQDKVIQDVHKSWTINFKSSIDFNTVKNSIVVTDKNDNTNKNISIVTGNSDNSVILNSPSEGYKLGHTYEIRIDKNIAKSKSGTNLKRTTIMNFTVQNSSSTKFKVEVSQLLPNFKRLTLNTVSNPNIKKFKIEGNDKLCCIGEKSTFLINESTIKIYFYSDDGNNLIGTGVLDVSSSNENIGIDIQ